MTEEESELEEEVEQEINSENLKEVAEEISEDDKFQEFLQPTGEVIASTLEKIQDVPQQINLEQDIILTPTDEEKKEQKGYVERLEDAGIDYKTQEPENLEIARPVPAMTANMVQGPMPLTRRQRITVDTELDQMRTLQQEKGEYIVDVEKVNMERHLPFEDPKRRYKEKPI